MPIKQRIIALRKRKGLTQRAFSEAISIDSSQYSKIEQGKSNKQFNITKINYRRLK